MLFYATKVMVIHFSSHRALTEVAAWTGGRRRLQVSHHVHCSGIPIAAWTGGRRGLQVSHHIHCSGIPIPRPFAIFAWVLQALWQALPSGRAALAS